MSALLDLLMPKLGLTMTEGTVAQWLVAEGTRFSRGAILAIIETDKIASDIEAPADGIMGPLLVNAGHVAKVGTPIGRWTPEAHQEVAQPAARPVQKADIECRAVAVGPVERIPADRNRIVATPYARKLAREAGVDLATIKGSGPNGRIKGLDVQQAPAANIVTQPAPPLLLSPSMPKEARHSIAIIDFSAVELFRVAKRISRPEIDQIDWIILALARCGVRWIGIAEPTDPGSPVVLELPGRLSISAVGDLRRTSGSGPVPANEFAVSLIAAGEGIRSFIPAPRGEWRHALGISASRRDQTITLGLSYDCSLLGHARAHRLLADLRDLLEEPLSLMAG